MNGLVSFTSFRNYKRDAIMRQAAGLQYMPQPEAVILDQNPQNGQRKYMGAVLFVGIAAIAVLLLFSFRIERRGRK